LSRYSNIVQEIKPCLWSLSLVPKSLTHKLLIASFIFDVG